MPTQEEWRQEAVRRGLIPKTSILEAGLRGGEQGISLGFGDEFRGVAASAGARARGGTEAEQETAAREATARTRREYREAQTDRPVSTFGGEAIASLAPGAAAFRGARLAGLGARPALYTSGAGVGAVHGAGSGETPEQRALSALLGAGTGLGGTAVGEAAGYGLSMLGRQGLDPAARAARLMAREVRQSAPTEQDIMRRLVRQGVPAARARAQARQTIEAGTEGEFQAGDIVERATRLPQQGGRVTERAMEMFPRGRRAARAIRAQGGPGAGIIERDLTERGAGQTERVLEQADLALRPAQTRSPGARGRARQRQAGQTSIDRQPPLTGFQEFRQRLDVARRGQSREAYREAYGQALTPEQQALAWNRMRGGGFKENARNAAIDRAEEDIVALTDRVSHARATGRAVDELEEELLDVRAARDALQNIGASRQSPTLNARALDLYQRGLRHLEDVAGGARTEGGRNIANVRRTFAETLDSVAPRLRTAIDQYRATRSVEEYLDAGRSLFTRRTQGEVDDLLRRQMSTEERDAFMVGALEAIEDQIAQGGGAAVMKMMRNQNWMSMIQRASRTPAAARRLRQRIERTALERETEQFVNQGSQTTPIAQDIRQLGNEDELGFVADLIQSGGDVRNPLLRRAAQMWDRLRQAGINNPQVAREMARMLTTRATPDAMRALSARIQAAPRSPIFLPAARRQARNYGLFGAAATRPIDAPR